MSERAVLVRHIIEQPDDEAARLVFADWLDEHGEADFAKFIRLQISRENDPSTESFRGLTLNEPTGEEAALLRRHRARWLADLPIWARTTVGFRRGFIEDVHTTVRKFTAAASSLGQRVPLLGLSLDGSRTRQVPRDFSDELTVLDVTMNGRMTERGVFALLKRFGQRLRFK